MRVTKKMLEEQNMKLIRIANGLRRENELLNREINFFKQHSPPGVASCMLMSLEKVTDALAHTITALERRT